MKNIFFVFAGLILWFQCVFGGTGVVMQDTQTGGQLGSVFLTDTPYGLLITPQLKNLAPGIHGFHVHAKPDCAHQGDAAGSHFDPKGAGKHAGPYVDSGHLGDLPPLYVDGTGTAQTPVLAPRLSLAQVLGLSLMIHAGGDNFSDSPKPLGGGGSRVGCGAVVDAHK